MTTKQIYHNWENWECYKSGFYQTLPPKGMTKEEAEKRFAEFLNDSHKFEGGIKRVFNEWKHSCEHFLTNPNINNIAWLGQASVCIELGIPSIFKGGFRLLTSEEQMRANDLAFIKIKEWEKNNEK